MKAVCPICPHACALSEGQTGFCLGRKNVDGCVIPVNYGMATSLALDPLEKKPFARLLPGKQILSMGSFGCNLKCAFCQNHTLSTADAARANAVYVSPSELIRRAVALKRRDNVGVAFTYNEPLISYEYIMDAARLARENGLITALVTNGMINETPLVKLLPLIDALNIDLKGFTQTFYDKVCGDLKTVKRTIALSAESCHVEVTTLIIPGENDSENEMRAEAEWLASIDENIVLHISRFFPRHEMLDKRPTPVTDILRLRDVAAKRLRFVYTGNV